MLPTVFNLYGTDRLAEWKKFRDQLEISEKPFEDLAEFWGSAPFVNPYLDPNNPAEWPDPWHLILDDRLDDLAIALGMLYTLKLTRRFMDTEYEIHTSMPSKEKQPRYFLLIDKKHVLNLEYKHVVDVNELSKIQTNKIWSNTDI